MNRMHIYNDGDQDVHRFLDLDYEDSIYVPEKSVETGEDEESSVCFVIAIVICRMISMKHHLSKSIVK